MRRANMPRAGDARGLNLEEEDEKESDRHRWRQQQSQNDPGAKACEATCIFCVGMLFLQVAWILYTYGVQGTMNLLMAPEEALGGGLRSANTYLAVSPPPGYGSEVTVLHDAESGLQRTHYTVDGNLRVVMSDARTRTTHWLFYEAPRSGGVAELAACYVLANDTSLRFGTLHPRDSFSQHSGFKLLSEVQELAPAPVFEPAKCIPFSRTGAPELSWAPAPWTRPAGPSAPALSAAPAPPGGLAAPYGKWCGVRHGGFHDCCDGKPCRACSAADGVSAACLEACAPVSSVDAACAAHDACVAREGAADAPCAAEGGSCTCLAQLATAVQSSNCKNAECESYAAALRTWLAKDAPCWGAGTACQRMPCTTDAATGWCEACGFFKNCRTLAQKAPGAL